MMEAQENIIGKRVREEREARQLSQEKLAAAAGLSSRTVLNIEQGSHSPTMDTLRQLSEALEVSLVKLLE